MRLIRLHTEDGHRIAVVGNAGRKFTPAVWIDCPIRLRKIPNTDIARYATDYPAPIKKSARAMLRAAKSLGITKGARKHLRGAL